MENIRRGNIILVSVFLTSFASLFAEIALTRIFSVTLYYHSAFFVISLAMFGLALGGAVLFIFKERLLILNSGAVLYAVFASITASFLAVILTVPRITLAFSFAPKDYAVISGLFIICQSPFFFIGFLMSYLFLHFDKKSGTLYFFDLAGASVGALGSVVLINLAGPINSFIILGIIASSVLAMNAAKKRLIFAAAVVIAGYVALLLANVQFKPLDIKYAKGKKMDNLFTKWNSFSMIRVHGSELNTGADPFGWGMSSSYQGTYPPRIHMDIDADAYTPITKFNGDLKSVEFLKHDVTSFVYHLCHSPDVLIIGPGGGRDILTALIFKSNKIVGVEVNPIIVNDVMKSRFKDYSGNIYGADNVRIVVDDARSYIRNSTGRYDVIQASLVDTWAATNAGVYSLSENILYTVESISEYISHLSPDGYLTISRWFGGDSQKLTVLFMKAAEKMTVADAGKHLLILKSGLIVNHIFKRSPYTKAELDNVVHLAGEMNYEILYMAGRDSNNDYARIIGSKDLDALAESSSVIDLKAPTDDSPFYFNKVRLSSVPMVFAGKIKDVGIFMLYGLLAVSAAFSLILIVIPMLLRSKDLMHGETNNKLRYLAFFSLLGIGFILTEATFLQKFILFLGHPIYAIVVVIFSFLFSAGIGSLVTSRIPFERSRSGLNFALLVIVGVLVFYNLLLYPLFNALIGLSVKSRIAISVSLLSGMGFFMGMPFPLGIRLLGAGYKGLIPFCWSLNGVFTVMGSVLAVILAMNIGFTNTIFIAAGLYLAAFGVIRMLKE